MIAQVLNKKLIFSVLILTSLSFNARAFVNYSVDETALDTAARLHTYSQTLEKIELDRLDFDRRLRAATSNEEKNAIVVEAQKYLAKTLVEDVVPAWYKTPWDYNGASNEPGPDSMIACGYFVSTVLHHMGFKYNRKDLGRQNSPWIIKSLSHPIFIKKSWLQDYSEFIEGIKEMGPGIYVVGMDWHVGFVAYDGEKTSFIHSYGEVVAQTTEEPSVLGMSKWRKVGKIFGYTQTVNWIYGREIPIQTVK